MAHDRKFRFGVQVSGLSAAGQNAHKYGAKDWQEMARKVEALGYSTLFMPDHFIDTELAPMVGIAFAAAASSSFFFRFASSIASAAAAASSSFF